MTDLIATLPGHLIAAAFVLTLFAVQWLQFKITSKPAPSAIHDDHEATFIEVAMPEDLRRFFASGAL